MKLRKLIQGLPIQVFKGNQELQITGLCNHSKLIAPGNLFIAKKGSTENGAKYVEEAIASGATAVLLDLPNPCLKGVVQLIHPQVSEVEAILAARYYNFPSDSLYMVGVTGTNGKTTTCYLIKHFFDHLAIPCGLIGTIEYIIGSHHFEADRTTPDAITNQKLFKEMIKQSCRAAVMEVSSHGMSQKRCEQIAFDTAIFTNLSQDHLDYHHTMEDYAIEKAKLFKMLPKNGRAIINETSSWSKFMVQECAAPILTYGFSEQATLYADAIRLYYDKTEFEVHYRDQKRLFVSPLIGRHNILNCLAAIACCLAKGIALQALPSLLSQFDPVPGRLERVDNFRGYHIFVDYAHTPDALEKVLACLQEIKSRKIITIFGCGGDRDRGKRSQMARVAEKGSDFTIVTSDNPRSEDPKTICDQIASGFVNSNFTIVVDRKEAIARAIEMADPKDLILIAGKGHEVYQHFSTQTKPFDDRKVAQEIANQLS